MFAIRRNDALGSLRWNSAQDAWQYVRWAGLTRCCVVRVPHIDVAALERAWNQFCEGSDSAGCTDSSVRRIAASRAVLSMRSDPAT